MWAGVRHSALDVRIEWLLAFCDLDELERIRSRSFQLEEGTYCPDVETRSKLGTTA